MEEVNGKKKVDIYLVPLSAAQADNYVYCVRMTSQDEEFYYETFMRPKLFTSPRETQYFYTFWIGVCRNQQAIVTEFVFKGEPDDEGAVEIGFHTSEKYEGKGYMMDTVGQMIEASRTLQGVKKLTAISDNPASIRILTKHGFELKDNLYTLNL